jgi:uncharacterized membrane protein
MWMAPFPPPQAVLEYEKALPGSWDRMLTMAEEAQAADIRNVQRKGEYISRGFMRGQVFGFVAMLFAMGSALCCVRLNRPWVAAAFLSVTVMAAARSFFGSANDRSGTSHTTNDPTSEPASDALLLGFEACRWRGRATLGTSGRRRGGFRSANPGR